MVSVSEPSPSGALFPSFHNGTLSGEKNAGNRVGTRAYREYKYTEGNIITEHRNIEVKAAGIGISAAAFKVLHKSLSQKSGICYTGTEVLADGRKDFEIGRET